MARSAVLVLMLLAMLTAPAVAEDTAWSPAAVDAGPWALVLDEQEGAAGRLNLNENCPMVFSAWRRADGVSLVTSVYSCADSSTAAKYAGLVAYSAQRAQRPAVLGSNVDVASTETIPEAGFTVRRHWPQGGRVLSVRVHCKPLGEVSCFDMADSATKSFATAQGGTPGTYREPLLVFVNAIVATLLTMWSLFVGIPALIRLFTRRSYPRPVRPWWTDVGRVVRRVQFRSLCWGALVVIRRICYLLVVLLLVTRNDQLGGWVLIVVFAAVAAGCWWGAKRLWLPVFGVSRWRGFARDTKSRWHLVGGLVIWAGVRVGVAYLLVLALLSLFIESTGGFESPVLRTLTWSANPEEWTPYQHFLLAVIGIGAEGAGGLTYMVVLGGLVLLMLADQVSKRLLTPEYTQAGDGRAEILYLRNFKDDRMRLRASRLSRRGLLGRLSPRHTRPFEMVVLSRLLLVGDAYAVSDPDHRTFNEGISKKPLDHADWFERVKEMAERAWFVVVSVTPEQISETGFLKELEFLSNELSHKRIVLVVGSWRRRRLEANWSRFLAATEHLPLFAPLRQVAVTLATQVMVHLPGIGWEAWGARTRSEWSYAVSLDLALQRARFVWRAG